MLGGADRGRESGDTGERAGGQRRGTCAGVASGCDRGDRRILRAAATNLACHPVLRLLVRRHRVAGAAGHSGVAGAERDRRGTGLLCLLRRATHYQSSRRMARRASRTEMDRGRRVCRALAWFRASGGGRFAGDAASGARHPGCRGGSAGDRWVALRVARSSRRRCGDDRLQPLNGRRRERRAPQRRVPDGRVWLAGGVLAVDGRFRGAAGWLVAGAGASGGRRGPGARPGKRQAHRCAHHGRARSRRWRRISWSSSTIPSGSSPCPCWGRRSLASMPVRWG